MKTLHQPLPVFSCTIQVLRVNTVEFRIEAPASIGTSWIEPKPVSGTWPLRYCHLSHNYILDIGTSTPEDFLALLC